MTVAPVRRADCKDDKTPHNDFEPLGESAARVRGMPSYRGNDFGPAKVPDIPQWPMSVDNQQGRDNESAQQMRVWLCLVMSSLMDFDVDVFIAGYMVAAWDLPTSSEMTCAGCVPCLGQGPRCPPRLGRPKCTS